MTVTIRQVAKRLGLSITTVSRALDGYADVAEETRQRVIFAAQDMGYVPSRAARQMRTHRSETLGYILPGGVSRFFDPSFQEFVAGLGDEAAAHNYDLLISTAPAGETAERQQYIHWVQSERVDGLIVNRLRLDDWRLAYLAQNHFPFVTSGYTPMPFDYPCISVDGHEGMRKLVAHLVERGHKKIAYIGGPGELAVQVERLAGYRAGLAEAGLPFCPEYCQTGDLTRQAGCEAGERLLDLPEPPTAITAINDLMALGVLRPARARGLRVGVDLAVTGFDGLRDAEDSNPPLTTLDVTVYDLARRLAHRLLQVIRQEPLASLQEKLVPEPVIRASSSENGTRRAG